MVYTVYSTSCRCIWAMLFQTKYYYQSPRNINMYSVSNYLPPASEVRWTIPRLISRFPILLTDCCFCKCCWDCCCWCCWLLVDDEIVVFECTWACDGVCGDICCWVVVDGFLNDVRIPFEGYNGYYRPAIRTQSLLLSLLLYQMPVTHKIW